MEKEILLSWIFKIFLIRFRWGQFEMKYQEIHKKEGAFEYADITYLEDNEKFRIKYESKIKKT